MEGVCLKTTIADMKNYTLKKRRYKPITQLQTKQNSIDLTDSPPPTNKKRKCRIIYDTSSDEDTITNTHKKKQRKKETNKDKTVTLIDLAKVECSVRVTRAGIPRKGEEYTYRTNNATRNDNTKRRPFRVGCGNARDAARIWELVLESCNARSRVTIRT